jgi:uncharacterized membrane protein YjjP (DUF1212 family)
MIIMLYNNYVHIATKIFHINFNSCAYNYEMSSCEPYVSHNAIDIKTSYSHSENMILTYMIVTNSTEIRKEISIFWKEILV